MINMFLSPATNDEDLKDPLLYEGQAGIQVVLVLTAVACVPTMLFAGPCLRKRANRIKLQRIADHRGDFRHSGVALDADEEASRNSEESDPLHPDKAEASSHGGHGGASA